MRIEYQSYANKNCMYDIKYQNKITSQIALYKVKLIINQSMEYAPVTFFMQYRFYACIRTIKKDGP